MTNPTDRAERLEDLLGNCVFALEALLTSPDLNLDCLEQATRDAIEVAQEMLQAAQKALQEEPTHNAAVENTATLSEQAPAEDRRERQEDF